MSSFSAQMQMNSPQKIGRYEIQGELGRGAMGVVYRALDPNIGRTVALKTMRIDVHGVDEEEILRRFKHEAKLAGVINHPNVVTIYDAGEDQGIFYIAMEYVEGVTLQTLLHQQRVIPAQLLLEITKQICPAMDYAHKRGVIHRDIKPANIMLTSQGGAKIMDFGIAKAEGGMTSAGQVLGTPAYMSPEQVRGKMLDGRSDLFSYGVCLYEMITGEKPFTGQNVTTIIYKIMNEHPVPPRDLDISIHPGLSALITKALAKDPKDRFQSGKELVNELEHYKEFGSNSEATQVLSAVSAETVVMSPAPPPPSPPATTPSLIKKVRQTATLIGTKGGVGKPGSVESIESTVTVQQKAATGGHSLLDKRKLALMLVALVIVVFGSVAIHKRNRAKEEAAQAEVVAPAATQSSSNATSAPPDTNAAANHDKKDEPATNLAKDPTPEADNSEKKPAAAKQVAKSAAPLSAVTVPPPPPVAEFGSVHVTSNPAGAKVTIGGVSETDWVTPFTTHKIKPGEHDVTFTKSGYAPQKHKASVSAGKIANVSADLVAAVAKINIKSTPAGANILLDGNPTGKVTPAVLDVEPGTHKVMVRQPGYQEENTSVTLKEGESYDFSPTLEAMKVPGGKNPFRAMRRMFGGGIPEGQGIVQVQSNPPGAEIVFRGRPWPKTTPARGPMDPGTYQIVLRLEGYKPVRKEFTIEKGKVTDVTVDLEPR